MFLRILGQHFHFNFHPIQAILRQISVFIKCSKHLQCFCVEIPRRIYFDNQKIFFSIFFSKTAWISLKSLPKQPIATFHLKSRLPYNTTYGWATQAVCAHCFIYRNCWQISDYADWKKKRIEKRNGQWPSVTGLLFLSLGYFLSLFGNVWLVFTTNPQCLSRTVAH